MKTKIKTENLNFEFESQNYDIHDVLFIFIGRNVLPYSCVCSLFLDFIWPGQREIIIRTVFNDQKAFGRTKPIINLIGLMLEIKTCTKIYILRRSKDITHFDLVHLDISYQVIKHELAERKTLNF